MNFKVCLLIFCLLQVAFFKDTHGRKGNGSHYADTNRCKVTCGSDSPVTLRKDSPRLEKNDFLLSQLQFDGACNCEMNLWGNANYGGATFNSPYGQRKGNWSPSSVWSTKPQSWRVDCQF